jgi:thiosulfate dehydrogenase [quinone] large subunit
MNALVSLSRAAGGATPETSPPGPAATLPWWRLAPLRLFLGVTFVYAGLQKLTDPTYLDPRAAGYIGTQLAAFAAGSPLRALLLHVAVPHAQVVGALTVVGELAIGLATLAGLYGRPVALGGACLSGTYFLTATWLVRPYFFGADIVFVVCWLTLLLAGSGPLSVDAALARRRAARRARRR